MQVMLVNEHDQPVGSDTVQRVHQAPGRLHRSLVVVLRSEQGRVLIAKRALGHPWEGYQCAGLCDHALPDMSTREQARALLRGIEGSYDPQYLFRFRYHASRSDGCCDREICHTFLATVSQEPAMEGTWETIDSLTQDLRWGAGRYTPRLRVLWPRLMRRWNDSQDMTTSRD